MNQICRFILRTTAILAPVWLFVGMCFHYYFNVKPMLRGDLERLGKFAIAGGTEYDSLMRRIPVNENLNIRYTLGDTTVRIGRVAAIGDSFSQRGAEGYQNFLAHRIGEPVVNLTMSHCADDQYRPEESAIKLLDAGFFDTLRIRTLIIECVGRNLVTVQSALDCSGKSNPLTGKDMEWWRQTIGFHPETEDKDILGWIDTRNMNQTRDYLFLSLGASKSRVCHATLREPLFAIGGSELFFLQSDLRSPCMNAGNRALVTSKIDSLRKRFARKGIDVLYLVAADKYETYAPYIAENTYPPVRTCENLGEHDGVVNSLFPLRRALERGERDLFLAGDTHWSYKGASVVADEIADKMAVAQQQRENSRKP